MKLMPEVCADASKRLRDGCKTRVNAIQQFLQRRHLERQLTALVLAAQSHEAQGLAPGSPVYVALNQKAEGLVQSYTRRWKLDAGQLHAEFPVMTKFQRLALPAVHSLRVARGLLFPAVSLFVFFAFGILAGISHLGYRLAGGGK